MKQRTLSQLIKSLKLDYVNENITEKNFPFEKNPSKEVGILHFNEYLTTEKVLEKMEEQGYRPATLQEMLLWAKSWNGEDIVVPLGSVWRGSDGGRDVPCLGRGGSRRHLDLSWTEDGWDGDCRFLASPQVGTRKSETLLDSMPSNFGDSESRILELEKFKVKVEQIINLLLKSFIVK